jgi:SAM-dependent methyltransferase
MTTPGSPSLSSPDYWWYVARTRLLRSAIGGFAENAKVVLDVGSADGPSVGWLSAAERKVSMDIDPRGLPPGGVCGSATALPFASGIFDLVAAFDVIEHCDPEELALGEIARVLTPGGVLLMSVPAYQWAWTSFDVANHHHRRYTRARAVRAAEKAGLEVERATYAFASTFPMFAADRLRKRWSERSDHHDTTRAVDGVPELPRVSPLVERVLLGASALDEKLLGRTDLPFGSSVVLAARKS